MVSSERGPVIWSRPRVNTLHYLCLSFHFLPLLPSLPSSLQHLLASLSLICNRKYPSGMLSCQVQLQLYFRFHRLQLSSTIFQVQLLAVLQESSCYIFLLPIFKFSCNCTSGLLRLQLFSTFFDHFKFNGWFIGVLFDCQYLIT
jgi:hypothetical protein